MAGKNSNQMSTLALEQPRIRRKPGRPRVPGRMSIDTQTGMMGIFVKNCDHGWPILLNVRDFDALMLRGAKSRKSWTVRALTHLLALKDI